MGVKGLRGTQASPYPHGIGLTRYRWSPVCLSVCLLIKPDYSGGPRSKVTTSLSVCLGPSHSPSPSHTHTHMNEWLTGRVSARVVTLHIKLWRLLWLYTPRQGESVWAWKVNTIVSSPAARTLSLFSSQGSAWKAALLGESPRRGVGSVAAADTAATS